LGDFFYKLNKLKGNKKMPKNATPKISIGLYLKGNYEDPLLEVDVILPDGETHCRFIHMWDSSLYPEELGDYDMNQGICIDHISPEELQAFIDHWKKIADNCGFLFNISDELFAKL
jgi:hypothetical protein